MNDSRGESTAVLVFEILLVCALIAIGSTAVYFTKIKVTCTSHVLASSTSSENDATLSTGQTYTIPGRDGEEKICKKFGGEVTSKTTVTEAKDTRIVHGTKPAPTPTIINKTSPTYSTPYIPYTPTPTYTPPKTTYCNNTYSGGFSCTTY